MIEEQPSQEGLEPSAVAGAQPAPGQPQLQDPKVHAFGGGMLAGIAIGIALAVVLHVIQQASPNGGECS
jgi:hypothetical protein